jgi:hypothetical protein
MVVRNICTPRWKSRFSYTFSTVASSGKPSNKFNVPRRVLIRFSVVMDGGISVAIRGLVSDTLVAMSTSCTYFTSSMSGSFQVFSNALSRDRRG